jgi:hypothetical protein
MGISYTHFAFVLVILLDLLIEIRLCYAEVAFAMMNFVSVCPLSVDYYPQIWDS